MSIGQNTKYTVSHEEVSKKDKQFTTVTTYKKLQNYYNEKYTCNVNTCWNLLYVLKLWNYLNFV